MKKLTHLWFLLAMLILGGPALAEKTPLETVLPQDAWLAVIIDDIPQTRAGWKNHPLARLWEDPQIKKFLAPLHKQMESGADAEKTFKEHSGKSFEEVLAMLQGGVAFAMTELPEDAFAGAALDLDVEDDADKMSLRGLSRMAIKQGMRYLNAGLSVNRNTAAAKEQVPGMIFVIDTTSGKDAEELFSRMTKQEIDKNNLVEDREDYRGVQMAILKDRNPDVKFQMCRAMVGNLFVLTTRPADLKKSIDTIQDKAASATLDKSPTFQQIRQHVGKTDAIAYVDAARLLKLITDGMEKARGGKPEQPNPFIPGGSKAIIKALGFDAMRGVYVAMKMHETHTDLNYGLTYTEDRGLIKLFASVDGPLLKPAFIPANVIQVDAARFSFNNFYKGVMQIVSDLAPAAAGMVQAQLAQFKTQTNVDVEKDLLGNLGDDMLSVNFPIKSDKPNNAADPAASIQVLTSSAIMISLKDKQAFETAFHSLVAAAAPGGDPFEKKQYLGHTIYTVPGEEVAPAFAFTDKWLMFSPAGSDGIQNLLIAMGRQEPGIWEKPDVKAALEMLPANAAGVTWSDLGAVLASLTTTFGQLAELGLDNPLAEFADLKASPDAKVWSSYINGVSGSLTKDNQAIRVLNRLHHKPSDKP